MFPTRNITSAFTVVQKRQTTTKISCSRGTNSNSSKARGLGTTTRPGRVDLLFVRHTTCLFLSPLPLSCPCQPSPLPEYQGILLALGFMILHAQGANRWRFDTPWWMTYHLHCRWLTRQTAFPVGLGSGVHTDEVSEEPKYRNKCFLIQTAMLGT